MDNYKIRKAHKLDNQRFYNLLSSEVDNKTLVKDIKDHIRNETCFKLQNETGEVLGVFLCKRFKTHYSLSYFFLKEEVRRKPIALKFFLHCTSKLNPLVPIYIKKNKNLETYARYFETTQDEDILRFKGLRDTNLDEKIKEALKWVE
jgi:hypothetical protein